MPCCSEEQMIWEAHVVQYVTYIHLETCLHGNAKVGVKPPRTLDKGIPLYGPRFVPPSYLHQRKKSLRGDIRPETAYLKPLNVVHPFYYKGLQVCPRCGATDNTYWNSWTGTGHREVHGLQREECAIGYQLRCRLCSGDDGRSDDESPMSLEKVRVNEDDQHCFATTSSAYWKKWDYVDIPCTLTFFLGHHYLHWLMQCLGKNRGGSNLLSSLLPHT